MLFSRHIKPIFKEKVARLLKMVIINKGVEIV